MGVGDGWPTETRDPGPVAGLAKASHIHRSNLTCPPPATVVAGTTFVERPEVDV